MKKKILIQYHSRRKRVNATVFGEWAVHESVNFGTFWTITHVKSGLQVDRLCGWATDSEHSALSVARHLARRLPIFPRELVGADVLPGTEAQNYALIIEAIAAEALADCGVVWTPA